MSRSSSIPNGRAFTRGRRGAGIAPLLAAAAALLALGACGGGEPLEGADTTGVMPNAAGYGGATNYDTAASPGGPDSSLGEYGTDRPRPAGMAGDTMSVRPRTP